MAGTVRRLAAGMMWTLGLAATLAVSGIATAHAVPSCRQLEAELTRASGSGSAKTTRKYDDAITRQRQQIDKARQRARSAGCGFSFFARPGSQCGELNATVKSMQANLQSLEQTRERLGKTGSRSDRARILAALDARGCRPKKNSATAAAGDGAARTDANAGVVIRGTGSSSIYYPLNRPYRTQCVRTCDGYFFPMSKSATPADFQRDQNRCEAACPGTRVEMFYGEGAAAEPANMISAVTGKRYADLPNALVFRRLDIPVDPACSCGAATPQGGASFVGGNGAPGTRITARPGSSVLSVEAPRGRAGTAKAQPSAPAPEREAGEDRKVRVVGPTFLPDQ